MVMRFVSRVSIISSKRRFATHIRNLEVEEVSILRRVEAGFSDHQLDTNINQRMRLEGFNLIQRTFIKKKHTEYY
jgi:hypothetical protein